MAIGKGGTRPTAAGTVAGYRLQKAAPAARKRQPRARPQGSKLLMATQDLMCSRLDEPISEDMGTESVVLAFVLAEH